MDTLKEWLPVHVIMNPTLAKVVWLKLSHQHIHEPFFHRSVANYQHTNPTAAELITNLDPLIEYSNINPAVEPAGFIFHSSRCGSTLISNLLQSIAGTVVIAEAQPISALLLPYSPHFWMMKQEEWQLQKTDLLKGVINAYGQLQGQTPPRLYIKFTSWNVLMIEHILNIWPNVPWLFVYRDPIEVIASHLKDPTGWPGLQNDLKLASLLTGLGAEEIAVMGREEFCARILGIFYLTAYKKMSQANALAVNYEHITLANMLIVLKFLGINPDTVDTQLLENGLKVYSKDSTKKQIFTQDSLSKRKAAHPLVHEMAKKWAFSNYDAIYSTYNSFKHPVAVS
jgi:hypothetical protein